MTIDIKNIRNSSEIIYAENSVSQIWVVSPKNFKALKLALVDNLHFPYKPEPPKYCVGRSFFGGIQYQHNFNDPDYIRQCEQYKSKVDEYHRIFEETASCDEFEINWITGPVTVRLAK